MAALVSFHSILVGSVQNHQFDISQSFGQYHDLSIYNEHVLNHITFQQLVRLSLNDLGYHLSHHLKIKHKNNYYKVNCNIHTQKIKVK